MKVHEIDESNAGELPDAKSLIKENLTESVQITNGGKINKNDNYTNAYKGYNFVLKD